MRKIVLLIATIWMGVIASAQIQVSGKVTDYLLNEALPGATVMIKGTNIGTITDAEGNYTIEVRSEADELIISFIGYEMENVIVGNQTVINISLIQDSRDMAAFHHGCRY